MNTGPLRKYHEGVHWLDRAFGFPERCPRAYNVLLVVAFAIAVYGLMRR